MGKIVLDTSIIIDGEIAKQIESDVIKDVEIIIPVAVLDELQSQASQNKDYGLVGLDEIKKIRNLSEKHGISIKFEGERPTADDIKLANLGRIDAMIKDVAKKDSAILYTSDHIQALVAEAEGITVNYSKPEPKSSNLEFKKFFDSKTMSVHLKEGTKPMAKRGKPGNFTLVELEDKILTKDYLSSITSEILEASRLDHSGQVEISKPGASVIQYEDFRIAITHPPFSNKYEITVVHPIVKLTLEQYNISEKLMKRFSESAEGILISGPPGSGKSTLASSLADFYSNNQKIVKTFESPRDLQVNNKVTQYTKLDGSFENSADILLMVRPDYTIFDEVRRFQDFKTFTDLRLAGVGMVGVVHANTPLDAIQRFIGKIELGMIPHVLDTVVFVKDGDIAQVYGLKFRVKVPTGMIEQDLARPVIEIQNFESRTLEYEIYSYGEENVIIPISKEAKRSGTLNYEPTEESYDSGSELETPFNFSESRNSLNVDVGKSNVGMLVELYVKGKYLLSSRVGRKGRIKIPKKTSAAKQLMRTRSKNDIKVFLKNY